MSALRRRESVRPVALEAIVSNPDPDELTVTIEDFDGDQLARHAWPAVSWPSSGTAMPARGDRCLVVMSEIGRAWVVAGEWTGEALSWTTLRLATGWSSDSSGLAPRPTPAYARTATGKIVLRGAIVKTSPPARDETLLEDPLPRAFWPESRRSFVALIGGGLAALVHALPNGQLAVGETPSSSPGPAIVTLDGISYWAED